MASLPTKRKVYLNKRPVDVTSYMRVEKINGIKYISYDTEKEIIDRLTNLELLEDEFERSWKEYDKENTTY